MGLMINTNVMAINAQHKLAATSDRYARALERLSSGLRINRAADDAAGLAVSEKLRTNIRGMQQAARNAQDGISMIQTAEGAMIEVSSMLQRMRELSVQAANDTLSSSDRSQINAEMQQLRSEVNSITNRTKFNGQGLMNGSLVTTLGGAEAADLVVGSTLTTTATAMVTEIDVKNARAGDTYTITSGAAGTLTLTRASDSVAQTITIGGNIAANTSRTLNFSQLGVSLSIQAGAAAKVEADLVTDLTAAADNTIVTAAGTGSANFQIGANASDFMGVSFDRVDISAAGLTALDTALTNFNTTQNVGNAQALITAIDSSIDIVNTRRATLGAAQNRLDHTIQSLKVGIENLSASESRIRDADVAEETTKMVAAQILTQAGTSVLAQANQAPQGALSLLRGG
jgi:flagellin